MIELKRKPDEDFREYQLKRKWMNKRIKESLKGNVEWQSSRVGTYRRADFEKEKPPVL